MTNLGSGKYSFQGTASPVKTLLLTSSLSGTATGTVAQARRCRAVLSSSGRETGRTEFKTEVENVNLAQGTVPDACSMAASQVVGHITLSAFSSGELELESQDGDIVPAVQAGDMVIVSIAGVTILSGVF